MFPVRSLIPNALTVLALCAGMFAIRFALLQKWELAVGSILIAGVFDALDGRVARLLKGTSKFGAELDSLSDMVCFGVGPALIMYMWVLRDIKGFGWLAALMLVVCTALRLARFNTMAQDKEDEHSQDYFTGIPAPAAAALTLFPMILFFELELDIFKMPLFCAIYVGIVAASCVSTIPTFSFKKVGIAREYVLFYLLGIALFSFMLVTYFWATMSVIGVCYLLSIPLAYRSSRKQGAKNLIKP